jgi:hypothetical protein
MEQNLPVPPTFKTNSPFYRMVSSFMAAMASAPAVFKKDNPMKFKPEDHIGLPSMHYSRDIVIFPHQIHRNAMDGYISMEDFKNSLCMMLANLAYESVMELRTQSPEWELFRHIRNASSHNNQFNFKRTEPSRPAHWRMLVIDTIKGVDNPLHGKKCFGNFMDVAELLFLLKDIEDNIESAHRP